MPSSAGLSWIDMYDLVYHKSVALRWHEFTRGQRILMIASELQRAKEMLSRGDTAEVINAYERAFELLDLTISLERGGSGRYELLRFREMLGGAYLNEPANGKVASNLLNVLVSLDVDSYGALH